MTRAPIIPDEPARLRMLQEYGIDAALADPGLDRIVQLAANIFRVPIVLVSLVEEARQLFAARIGTTLCETDRDASFCAHALGGPDLLIVPDARHDPRFAHGPLVVGPPGIRFYAGCPLVAPGGLVLGTLCVIDTQPRAGFGDEERAYLRDLAALVMDKLELHRLDTAWQASQSRFEKMADVSPDAIICLDDEARITFWNPAAERLFGYDHQTAIGGSVARMAPDAAVSRLLALAAGDAPLAAGRTIELEISTADGTLIPVEVSASMWRERGRASFCAVLRDVTERRRNEARLYRLAHIDALTDLPNRTLFRDRVEHALARTRHGCLMMVDLDGFKDVNDGFGHAAGDAMLVATARRLEQLLTPADTVARMGGDEFALFLPGTDDRARTGHIADALIDALSQPVELEGEPVTIGASVGIALAPHDGTTVRDLLSSADLALYEAKANGKHCRRFFSLGLREAALAKQAYQTELPRALNAQEWELHYQPVMRLSDDTIVGAQALLRWRHPRHGLLVPAAFMPALQSSPVASRVGHWLLTTACAQLAEWRRRLPDLRINVGVLDAQFRTGDLAAHVRQCLAQHRLPPTALELEITETILLRKDAQTLGTLAQLRADGIPITLAHYGTGHTSLDLLKRVPLNRLKIDPSFVQGMQDAKVDAAIIRVILYLGKSLDIAVTAEGVETEAQCERLRRKGCEEIQGAWLGEPMPATPFLALLESRAASPARAAG